MPVTRRLQLTLSGDAVEALHELAIREFRHPRDQATLLLLEGLRRHGALEESSDLGTPNRQLVSAGRE